jgi:hypothetical protein
MSPPIQLAAALADRQRIERELGQGGMACRSVAEATTRLLSLKRHHLGGRSHSSDSSRVAASAANLQINESRHRTDH